MCPTLPGGRGRKESPGCARMERACRRQNGDGHTEPPKCGRNSCCGADKCPWLRSWVSEVKVEDAKRWVGWGMGASAHPWKRGYGRAGAAHPQQRHGELGRDHLGESPSGRKVDAPALPYDWPGFAERRRKAGCGGC